MRGQPLPLVLIDQWIDGPPRRYRTSDPILVLESGEVRMGVVVDCVHGVLKLKPNGGGKSASRRGRAKAVVRSAGEGQPAIVDPSLLIEAAISKAADYFGAGSTGSPVAAAEKRR